MVAAASFDDRGGREHCRRGDTAQQWPRPIPAIDDDTRPLLLCSANEGGGSA